MTTEVYSCKDGQKLREGNLDYASDITTKEEAQADAVRRCQKDKTLKRVAYYSVSEDGNFRNFYTHTNANAASAKPAPKTEKILVRKKPRLVAKLTFSQKLLKLLGFG